MLYCLVKGDYKKLDEINNISVKKNSVSLNWTKQKKEKQIKLNTIKIFVCDLQYIFI